MAHPQTILQIFVQRDSPLDAYAALRDDVLTDFIAIWEKVPIRWEPPSDIPLPPTLDEQWQCLWQYVTVDIEHLAQIANLSTVSAISLYARAQSLRLIYPDGTICKSAKQVIMLKVAAALGQLRELAGSIQSKEKGKGGDTRGIAAGSGGDV